MSADQISEYTPRHWWERSTGGHWMLYALLICGGFFLIGAPDGMSWGSWTASVVVAVVVSLVLLRWHRQVVLLRTGRMSGVVWVRWGRAARNDSLTPPRVLLPGQSEPALVVHEAPSAAAKETPTLPAPTSSYRVKDEPRPLPFPPHPGTASAPEPVPTAAPVLSPPDTGRKICPDCAETVLSEARVCRYCGYRFDGASTT
jgi:hypothetical protein